MKHEINNKDINVDRGLELILSHGRKTLKEEPLIFRSKFKIFNFEFDFGIRKIFLKEKPCKKHSSQ